MAVTSFEPILASRRDAFGPIEVAIDGGAGWGDTAKKMSDFMGEKGRVYAFEPFPGNHRFFEGLDPRIHLMKSALSDSSGNVAFNVPKVVGTEDAWVKNGFAGYSSIGHLTNQGPILKRYAKQILATVRMKKGMKLTVPTVRIDDVITEPKIDFVKLDLQGAEYNALKGMGTLLEETDLLWIEYTGQHNLLELLCDKGFMVFDTNYICVSPNPEKLKEFGLRIVGQCTLSTSVEAIIASRFRDQANFKKWFLTARKRAGVLQTDLLAVNQQYISEFKTIVQGL